MKPKPPIVYRLWPDGGHSRARKMTGLKIEWVERDQAWMVWREDSPGHRVELHGWEKTEARAK